MKKSLFLFFFSMMTGLISYSQTSLSTNIQMDNIGLVVHFQDNYDSTLAKQAQDIIENFNPDKITYSTYNNAQKEFYIKHTPALDKVELLAIFREIGMEGYIIMNNAKYTLNGTSTGLDLQSLE